MEDVSDETVGDGHDIEQHRETTAAVFRALESVDADVSPELASSVQATINLIRRIDRNYGLLTEEAVKFALGLAPADALPLVFAVPYRGRELYPAFLFESAPDRVGLQRVRPVVAELGKLAKEHGWDGTDVIFWLMSPMTWFTDGGLPLDHLTNRTVSWPHSTMPPERSGDSEGWPGYPSRSGRICNPRARACVRPSPQEQQKIWGAPSPSRFATHAHPTR